MSTDADTLFKAFDARVSGVKLNFECRYQANFSLNVVCGMKIWTNVVCRNNHFMGPITSISVLGSIMAPKSH